jgi:hypothetical protein
MNVHSTRMNEQAQLAERNIHYGFVICGMTGD